MSAFRNTLAASTLLLALPALAGGTPTPQVATASTATAAAEKITAIGDVRRGSMVTVQGSVERILDTDEFRLTDATGSIRVDVGYPNFVPVSEGERVTVRGFVDRDLFRELYAREIVHADGRVTSLNRSRNY
jgi:uncharacterized protein YdeI (BOF family)